MDYRRTMTRLGRGWADLNLSVHISERSDIKYELLIIAGSSICRHIVLTAIRPGDERQLRIASNSVSALPDDVPIRKLLNRSEQEALDLAGPIVVRLRVEQEE